MNRRPIHRCKKRAARRSGLQSNGYGALALALAFRPSIRGLAVHACGGQLEAGSIRVIDSHDRGGNEGALRFSIAGSRNPCQGNGPGAITCDRFSRADLRARTHEPFVSLQISYLPRVSPANTIPLR